MVYGLVVPADGHSPGCEKRNTCSSLHRIERIRILASMGAISQKSGVSVSFSPFVDIFAVNERILPQ
jgi:hypothetical protein